MTVSSNPVIQTCSFQSLGAFFFMVVSWYVVQDKNMAERQIHSNADILEGTGNGSADTGPPLLGRGGRAGGIAEPPIYRGGATHEEQQDILVATA